MEFLRRENESVVKILYKNFGRSQAYGVLPGITIRVNDIELGHSKESRLIPSALAPDMNLSLEAASATIPYDEVTNGKSKLHVVFQVAYNAETGKSYHLLSMWQFDHRNKDFNLEWQHDK